MTNILLNNYCNLDCDYCFANEVRGENAKKLSMEDYQWLLDFLERSGRDQVRLIGGEPTLHENFPEFVLEASRRDFVNKIHVFSNGTYKSQYNELFRLVADRGKEVSMLMNYNSEHSTGPTNFDQMRENVKELTENSPVRLSLGINFYKPDQNFEHLLNTAEKYNIRNIRWALTIPQNATNIDAKDYFDEQSDVIYDFLKGAIERGLDPHPDCTSLPICSLSDEQIRELSLLGEENLVTKACDPIIDIKPDMTAIRCFAMDDYTVNVKDFETEKQLHKHFTNKVDALYQNEPVIDECETCSHFQNEGQTCSCLAYIDK